MPSSVFINWNALSKAVHEVGMNSVGDLRKYLAELIGTFVLVFIGCGAVVFSMAASVGGTFLGTLGIAFAFGLAVLAMVYAIGSISGCHINPAISVAPLTPRRAATGLSSGTHSKPTGLFS